MQQKLRIIQFSEKNMKLKYEFIIREIANTSVAVTVGEDVTKFNGMIKLNETGKFIFELLLKNFDFDIIVDKITEKYTVSKSGAINAVSVFIDKLKSKGLIEE